LSAKLVRGRETGTKYAIKEVRERQLNVRQSAWDGGGCNVTQYIRRVHLPVSAERAYQWHSNCGALERLNPPWERVEVVGRSGGLENGSTVDLAMHMGPLPLRWRARHVNVIPGQQFQDIQERGPFAKWEHTHRFEPHGEGACVLEDRIDYDLPLGILGRVFGGATVRRRIEKMFTYRHQITQMDLNQMVKLNEDAKVLTIAVTGASGLVGSALIPQLLTGGHRVKRLVRSATPAADQIRWDIDAGTIDADALEGVDAVIHLAGENIAGRWSAEKKRKIRDSRVNGTRLISSALAKLKRPPQVLVSASAIGFYGETGSNIVDENSPAGPKFLGQVCQEWEAEALAASKAGIRVVCARLGVVLSPRGGALAKMLTPFKLGAGGIMGSGKQYWSWVSIEDVIGALQFAVLNPKISGAMNVVAPEAATNYEFTKTLGKVMGRPTIFPMPAFAARLALGEMADELLLTSTRVVPKKLLANGYEFRFANLEDALRHLLGKTARVN
jgi:uncharacterized protein (TIGR01777 family)